MNIDEKNHKLQEDQGEYNPDDGISVPRPIYYLQIFQSLVEAKMKQEQAFIFTAGLNNLHIYMEERFNEVDKRFIEVNQKFIAVDQRFTELERYIDTRFAESDKVMTEKFAEVDKVMTERFAEADKVMTEMFAESDKVMTEKFAKVDIQFAEMKGEMRGMNKLIIIMGGTIFSGILAILIKMFI